MKSGLDLLHTDDEGNDIGFLLSWLDSIIFPASMVQSIAYWSFSGHFGLFLYDPDVSTGHPGGHDRKSSTSFSLHSITHPSPALPSMVYHPPSCIPSPHPSISISVYCSSTFLHIIRVYFFWFNLSLSICSMSSDRRNTLLNHSNNASFHITPSELHLSIPPGDSTRTPYTVHLHCSRPWLQSFR